MKHDKLFVLLVLSTASLVGCGSARDVEVKGTVASSAALQGGVQLEFYEITGEGENREQALVHEATLQEAGAFAETIQLESDKVLIRGIQDTDGDGACSVGEAWAEVEAAVSEQDTIEGVVLTLERKPCPTP